MKIKEKYIFLHDDDRYEYRWSVRWEDQTVQHRRRLKSKNDAERFRKQLAGQF